MREIVKGGEGEGERELEGERRECEGHANSTLSPGPVKGSGAERQAQRLTQLCSKYSVNYCYSLSDSDRWSGLK